MRFFSVFIFILSTVNGQNPKDPLLDKNYKGQCWVLIRIGRNFIGLIDGSNSKEVYNRVSKTKFADLLH